MKHFCDGFIKGFWNFVTEFEFGQGARDRHVPNHGHPISVGCLDDFSSEIARWSG